MAKDSSQPKELTLGQRRVGVRFNPSENPNVDHIKWEVSQLIDWCDARRADSFSMEAQECFREGMKQLENAAMWIVKGLTKPKE